MVQCTIFGAVAVLLLFNIQHPILHAATPLDGLTGRTLHSPAEPVDSTVFLSVQYHPTPNQKKIAGAALTNSSIPRTKHSQTNWAARALPLPYLASPEIFQ